MRSVVTVTTDIWSSLFAAYEATTSFNIEADKRAYKAFRPRIEKEQSKKADTQTGALSTEL